MMRTARALKKPCPGLVRLGLLALAAPGALVGAPWGAASAQAACPDARALETRLRGAPGDLALTLNLGRAYLCAGRYRDAQLAFEDAVALDYRGFDAHFYLGRALFEQGSLDAALFEYTQLSSLYPDRLEPLYNRGVVLARLKKPDDAIAAFRAAIEAGRKSNAPQANIVDAYVGLAAQQRAKNDAAGAAQTYAEALEVRAGDPALTLGRAQALLDAGRGPEALPLAYELLAKNPANLGATLLAVDVYEGQGLPDRAVREIDRALEAVKAGRERSSLYLRRGLVLQKAGRKADAAESFLAAAGANPESWEAQYNLGASLLGSKPADALARFQLAAKLRPDDGETQLGIATAQDALKNHPAAYAAAKGAAGLLTSPALQARARYLAGRNAYLAGRPSEAAGELKPLVAADPNNFDYQLWHGLSLYAIKDYAGAAASLEAALKARPASSLARTNLGAAYVAAKRYPDAEQVLRPVVTAEPRNADALTNLGLALANLNRTAEARELLRRASTLGSATARRALEALASR